MNYRLAKRFLLLLVVILATQPVQAAFAMGSMDSGSMPAVTPSDGIDVSCAYHSAHKEVISGDHQPDKTSHHQSVFDDCCSTPACHAVGIISFVPVLRPAVAWSLALFETSMQGITLPAERKPPRASHA